jgi:hypothetical protein
MRFEMRSISEAESGSPSAPMVTGRPWRRNPCMLSTIDLVEFEVQRTECLLRTARCKRRL